MYTVLFIIMPNRIARSFAALMFVSLHYLFTALMFVSHVFAALMFVSRDYLFIDFKC